MKAKWDIVLTTTLVVCALAITILVAHREFFAPTASTQTASQSPVYIKSWISELGHGMRLGLPTAPVQLIEFADFECPYCAGFDKTLTAIREHYPGHVTLTFVHFPLQMHRFAIPAARVAECAGEQGRFEAMDGQLFEGQDQFGVKPWDDYAKAAGIPDMPAFDACIKKTDPIPRVEEGKALGAKLDVQGTPTIIINGWKLGQPPTEQELNQMVQRVLAGKQPVDGKS